jgi:hypothetical protein
MRASTTWKEVQTRRNYVDFFQPGDRFASYIRGQERTISAAFNKLGIPAK